MSRTSFDESKALELYRAHKTDSEIAKGVGALTATIRNWRKYRFLPNISPNARPRASYPQARKIINQVKGIGGVNYRKALSPSQAEAMNRFLRALAYAGQECAKVGIRPDVNGAINAWSGRTKSDAGIKADNSRRYKERVANAKK